MKAKPKRVRDGEGSRRRILAAAELAFSRKGFDASSLDDIARRAGVTKQLIVHHFGGKKDLYAVIHTLRVRANLALEKSAKGGLASLAASRYTRLAADPDFIRFLVWECARNWDHELPGTPERRDTIKEQLKKLGRLQLDEEIRNDVDVRFLLLGIFALTTYPLAFAPITRTISGMDPSSPRFRRQWLSFLQQLMSSLKPDAAPGRLRTTGNSATDRARGR